MQPIAPRNIRAKMIIADAVNESAYLVRASRPGTVVGTWYVEGQKMVADPTGAAWLIPFGAVYCEGDGDLFLISE